MNAKLIDTMANQAITTTEGMIMMALPIAVIFAVLVGMAYAHAVHVTGNDPIGKFVGRILLSLAEKK